jgi:signal transduction histidine kinase
MLALSIEDDGVGVEAVARPEDATGQGLALHSTMMAVIGGQLILENRTGGGTALRLILPNSRKPVPPASD